MNVIVERIFQADQRRIEAIQHLEQLAADARQGSMSAAWAGAEELAAKRAEQAAAAAARSLHLQAEMGTLTLARLGDCGRVLLRPDGQMLAVKDGAFAWAMPWTEQRELALESQVWRVETDPHFDWRHADPACIRPH